MKLLIRALMLPLLLGAPTLALAQEPLTLIWGDDGRTETGFDPRVTSSRGASQITQQVHDGLIYMAPDGTLHPWLATSWSVAEDAKSISFTLREGVTFHDGTPFDAEAVKFTLDTIADPATASQSSIDVLGPYDYTEVAGPLELTVHYKTPNSTAELSFAGRHLAPVSPTAVGKLGNEGFARAPVGTGPFKFASWTQDQEVVLERNENYQWWPEGSTVDGPAQYDRVSLRFIPDASTRVAALEAGEIDIAENLPPLDLRRLQDSGQFVVNVSTGQGLPPGLLLNTSRGPLADINVRKALILAIDRERLVNNLFFGFRSQAFGPVSSAMDSYWSGVEDYYKFDLAESARLLDEAGWVMGDDGYRSKDGERLSLYLPALFDPDTAVALQADLKRVGMDLAVETVLKPRQDELIVANQYDMAMIQWLKTDASVLENIFHSRNIPDPTTFKYNWTRFDSPELDALLDGARATLDPAERLTMYQDAQKYIMDQAIYVPLYDQITSVTYRPAISNVQFIRSNGNFQVDWRQVQVSE